ncbi:hypothetical protein ACFVZD_36740 [Streptomyces sp. NPDC058287]|uniref:hypothetical protein n=1 Tax=Streptomyces sp. NPDC058287 TaxID=3346423 RepID=UPI0036F12AB3
MQLHDWEPRARDLRGQDLAHLPSGASWVCGDPEVRRYIQSAAYEPQHDTTVAITDSDGEVVREEPWPQARLLPAGPDTFPTATHPGPTGLVPR